MLTSPHLITPNTDRVAISAQGQPIQPLVDGTDAGNIPGSPLCAGWVRMEPGGYAEPHEHRNTPVYILVWSAGSLGAITLYGESLAGRIYQHPGQLLVIPPGVPHAAVNPSPTYPVVAYEFRPSPSMGLDNIIREDLRHLLDRQLPIVVDVDADIGADIDADIDAASAR